jgi:hypothetical protein
MRRHFERPVHHIGNYKIPVQYRIAGTHRGVADRSAAVEAAASRFGSGVTGEDF